MADWKTVGGKVVAAGAPILGRIIGEFIPIPGGGLLAEWGIRKLAEAIGVAAEAATPDTLGNAIQNSRLTCSQKLETAEREAESRYGALVAMHKATAEQNTAIGQAIDETQRAELAVGVSFWHWRHRSATARSPSAGSRARVRLGDVRGRHLVPGAAALINAVMPVILILAALNGYVAADTTALKIAAVTGQPARRPAAVIEAVKPKRK